MFFKTQENYVKMRFGDIIYYFNPSHLGSKINMGNDRERMEICEIAINTKENTILKMRMVDHRKIESIADFIANARTQHAPTITRGQPDFSLCNGSPIVAD